MFTLLSILLFILLALVVEIVLLLIINILLIGVVLVSSNDSSLGSAVVLEQCNVDDKEYDGSENCYGQIFEQLLILFDFGILSIIMILILGFVNELFECELII